MFLSSVFLPVPQLPAPEVYTETPSLSKEKKPGQLEKWQVDQFFNKGFVIVPKFFTDEEMNNVVEVTNGKISNKYRF